MTDTMEVYRALRAAAARELARGKTPEEMDALAAEQDAAGFGLSADYTRLFAAMMRDVCSSSNEG